MLRAVSSSRQSCLATKSLLNRPYSSWYINTFVPTSEGALPLRNTERSPNSKTTRKTPVASSSRSQHPALRRLLQPYDLSLRLRAICAADELDKAVELLQNAPHDSQKIEVWNLLVQQAMQKQRYSLAYSLAQQAKKRGFKWSLPTYLTLYSGWLQISDWQLYSVQLENCHATYEKFKEHIESLRNTNSATDGVIESHVKAKYIKILASAQQWQTVFDVFNDCDETGPFAANQVVYSTILQALAGRTATEKNTDISIEAQNASDAKFIWRQLMASHAKNNTPIDGYVIRSVLIALMHGRASDHLFGFDIIRDHLGLTRPGESPQKISSQLSVHTLQSVLRLCFYARKFRLIRHYMEQVMQDKPDIIDARHMSQLMRAHSELAASGSPAESIDALENLKWFLRQNVLQPHRKRNPPPSFLYDVVIEVCWRSADWTSAMEAFDLLTGYKAAEFSDKGSATVTTPTREDRSRGYNIDPDALALSFWARAALATEDKADMRQCLRIIHHLGFPKALMQGSPPLSDGNKYIGFHVHKLATAVMEMVEKILPSTRDKVIKGKWLWMRSKAQTYLKEEPHRGPIPTGFEHRVSSQLGQKELELIDAQVDMAMISRQVKPRIPSN